jgi:ketosteroid isomerase-like protein
VARLSRRIGQIPSGRPEALTPLHQEQVSHPLSHIDPVVRAACGLNRSGVADLRQIGPGFVEPPRHDPIHPGVGLISLPDARVIGGDVAYAHSLTLMGSAGVFSMSFRTTIGFRKTVDDWQIANPHISTPSHMDEARRTAVERTRPGVSMPSMYRSQP